MVYMAGDNNLSSAGDADLAEMRRVGSSNQVQVVVEFDNAGDAGTRRIHVTRDGVGERVEALGETDSGSPEVLSDFISWTAQTYPANRYALILWNHGGGWAPTEVDRIARSVASPGYSERELAERSSGSLGRVLFRSSLGRIFGLSSPTERAICSDDGSGHSLDTLELGRVIAQGAETIGQPFDLLGMDACLMSNLEVAYQLRGHVRYIVASEENEPGDGWPYDRVIRRLAADPEIATAEFARHIVTDYIDFYAERGYPGDVTQAALDLSRISDLTTAVDALAGRLRTVMPAVYADVWQAQRRSARFWHNTLWDLGQFCEQLGAKTADSELVSASHAVVEALEIGEGRTVIAEQHRGQKVNGCHGISIYLVPPMTGLSRFYGELDFAADLQWMAMLEAYHAI